MRRRLALRLGLTRTRFVRRPRADILSRGLRRLRLLDVHFAVQLAWARGGGDVRRRRRARRRCGARRGLCVRACVRRRDVGFKAPGRAITDAWLHGARRGLLTRRLIGRVLLISHASAFFARGLHACAQLRDVRFERVRLRSLRGRCFRQSDTRRGALRGRLVAAVNGRRLDVKPGALVARLVCGTRVRRGTRRGLV